MIPIEYYSIQMPISYIIKKYLRLSLVESLYRKLATALHQDASRYLMMSHWLDVAIYILPIVDPFAFSYVVFYVVFYVGANIIF